MVIVKPWICAAALFCLSVQAKDLPDYQIGDKAQDDITATVPFDVVDPQATAAVKISTAQTIAAIYRQVNSLTNAMAGKILAAFARARSSFSNAMVLTYNQPAIDNATMESSDFGYFVTAYNDRNKDFPVTAELAVTWAHGGSGAGLRDQWLGLLLQTMSRPVQPDHVPPHFIYQNKVRMMPVTNAAERLTFQRAWRLGYVMSADKVLTLSAARAKFRRAFSENDQPLASALAQFLQPDSFPDPKLTQQARDFTVRQLVVSDHIDAGQVIVHRGATIDAKAKAELDALAAALAAGALSKQVADEQERARQERAQAQSASAAAQLARQQQQQAQRDRQLAQDQASRESVRAAALREQALNAQNLARETRARDEYLFAALASVFALALLVSWRFISRQRMVSISAPVKLPRMEKPTPVAELAPYLAQTLKEAVVQGLAAQRAELLEAQRQAAAEIAELVQRLDRLQAPMQERLQAYQERIQQLQKELAERTEENRELLKLKIEMMRQQLETERARVKFN